MDLKGSVDPAAEIKKLDKKIELLQKSQAGLVKQMQNKDYETKVPAKVREENAEKLAKLEAEIEAAQAAVADFQKQL